MPEFRLKGEKAQWRLLVDFLLAQPADYVASNDELELASGCVPGGVSSLIVKANRMLKSDGVRFIAVRGQGYRRATPAECLAESTTKRPRLIARAIGRAEAASVAVVHDSRSTDWERKAATDAALCHADAARLMNRNKKQLSKLAPELPPPAKRSWEM